MNTPLFFFISDASITLLDAKKEEKDFINLTQEKLKPYDKNYMKDYGGRLL